MQHFRMLLMTAKPNPTSTGVYTFYSEGGDGITWTTTDVDEALTMYKDLLAIYTTTEMFLVDMVDTEVIVRDKDLVEMPGTEETTEGE